MSNAPGFITIRDPETNSFLFRYNPTTREVLIVTSVQRGSRREKKPCIVALDAVTPPVDDETVDKIMAVVV